MLKRLVQKNGWKILPSQIKVMVERYNLSKNYNKHTYRLKENAFLHIYEDNIWTSSESRSGGGSEISTTHTIRQSLPLIWEKYKIKTFLDAPCGDFNWMKEVNKDGIKYIGGDIVEELVVKNNELYGQETPQIEFQKIDITKDVIPKVDMIFCEDCLQHLSYESVVITLRNFAQSGCKYLMFTSYPLTIRNHDICDGDYRALNLFKKPFNLPKDYIGKICEKSKGRDVEIDKTMYLYDMEQSKLKDYLRSLIFK